MEVIIKPNANACCLLAAKMLSSLIRKKPKAVLGLATGRTPEPIYAELVRMHREEHLNFSQVTTFNLDEYVGLRPDDPASYQYYMREKFFRYINIRKSNIHIPAGLTSSVETFCEKYERLIRKAGGIDLQVLGVGKNGHIGFNEPISSLSSRTRIKTLSEKTRSVNKAFFSRSKMIPSHVLTMGIGTIMEARQCILIAYGKSKASVVAKLVEGPITAMVPASILQFHPKAVIILDKAAASGLKLQDYYHDAYEHKPLWQRFE